MKKYIFTICVFLIVLFCILFPNDMILSTKNALTLWWQIIVPSLFPFIILTNLLNKTILPEIIGKLLNPLTSFLFNLPGISSMPFILGLLSGYPIGAKLTSDLIKSKKISLTIANHLIKFVNNSGPLFIIGAIGIGLYGNVKIGYLLLLSHFLSALFTGILFRNKGKNRKSDMINFKIISISKLGNTFSETINNSIISILNIGGFIVFFSIISTILLKTGLINLISKFLLPNTDKSVLFAFISGLLEITNGLSLLSNAITPLSHKLVLSSILLSFGGFCIHTQTLGLISNTNIKISSYLLGKFIQSILSGIITYILLFYTKFSNLLSTHVFANSDIKFIHINSILSTITSFFIFCVIFKILQTIFYFKKQKHT